MFLISDKKYRRIVKDILRNKMYKMTYNIEHHGISRMEHLIKVSYYSYVIAKKLKFDYVSVARGALLHDFYLDGDERCIKEKFLDTFRHPRKSLVTSSNFFELNDIEQNIIVSHMFPFYFSFPKYKESFLVNLVDKFIGFKELFIEYVYKFRYRVNYTYLFLLLIIR